MGAAEQRDVLKQWLVPTPRVLPLMGVGILQGDSEDGSLDVFRFGKFVPECFGAGCGKVFVSGKVAQRMMAAGIRLRRVNRMFVSYPDVDIRTWRERSWDAAIERHVLPITDEFLPEANMWSPGERPSSLVMNPLLWQVVGGDWDTVDSDVATVIWHPAVNNGGKIAVRDHFRELVTGAWAELSEVPFLADVGIRELVEFGPFVNTRGQFRGGPPKCRWRREDEALDDYRLQTGVDI